MANEEMLKKAVEAFKALTPEQQAEMLEEQRQSWVRGNVGLSRDERGITTPVMPRPAAPVEGLETELWATYTQDGRMTYSTTDTPKSGVNEYVTRSQAEAIIAAERAKLTKEEADHTRSLEERDRYHDVADKLAQAIADRYQSDIGEHSNINDPWQNALNLIEADNAALTARVKELEKDFYDADKSDISARDLLNDQDEKIEALEAKLAAAEKALEPFVSFFNEAMKGFTEGYAERTPSDKPVLGWNNAYLLMRHFVEARAVLGGKPS